MVRSSFGRRSFGGSSVYNTAGETMSEKNVIAEFLLKESDLERGCEEGKLHVQWRSCHGHRYRLFVRSEVSEFAKTCEKDTFLKARKG